MSRLIKTIAEIEESLKFTSTTNTSFYVLDAFLYQIEDTQGTQYFSTKLKPKEYQHRELYGIKRGNFLGLINHSIMSGNIAFALRNDHMLYVGWAEGQEDSEQKILEIDIDSDALQIEQIKPLYVNRLACTTARALAGKVLGINLNTLIQEQRHEV